MVNRFIDDQIRRIIAGHIQDTPGLSDRAIARVTGVSRQTVARIRLYLTEFDTLRTPTYALRGRPRSLAPREEQFIINLLIDRPSAYLYEVQTALVEEFQIWAEIRTISRTIYRLGWSRKTLKRHALERSERLRRNWIGKMAGWRADQLIFIDESAANERTGYRKYGWSPQGVEAIEITSIRRSPRWSIVPAYSNEGWIDGTLCLQGSITSAIFLNWIKNTVLPYCRDRYEAGYPRQILIMDNASIHRNEELRTLCRLSGVELEFLPPYSPDYNPIEISFYLLKAWIREHITEAACFPDFGEFLLYAIQYSNAGRFASKHFDHCGYAVEYEGMYEEDINEEEELRENEEEELRENEEEEL